MFVKAIKKNTVYTKPLLTGRLHYPAMNIANGIDTLIIINEEGDILTSAHVADLFKLTDEINEVYHPILVELKDQNKKNILKIEKKYDIKEGELVGLHNILVDITKQPFTLNIIKHPTLDLAIIRAVQEVEVLINEFPTFRETKAQIGEYLCKLGYSFPEYDTFYYDKEDCKIKINNNFMNFPSFALDGMVTRNVLDIDGNVTMFEMSTPCLPGAPGGPIFDEKGLICGMQVGTKRINDFYHAEMDFSIDLGIGITSEAIMEFLDANNIKYNKAK